MVFNMIPELVVNANSGASSKTYRIYTPTGWKGEEDTQVPFVEGILMHPHF